VSPRSSTTRTATIDAARQCKLLILSPPFRTSSLVRGSEANREPTERISFCPLKYPLPCPESVPENEAKIPEPSRQPNFSRVRFGNDHLVTDRSWICLNVIEVSSVSLLWLRRFGFAQRNPQSLVVREPGSIFPGRFRRPRVVDFGCGHEKGSEHFLCPTRAGAIPMTAPLRREVY
jgi:hypothetical protein